MFLAGFDDHRHSVSTPAATYAVKDYPGFLGLMLNRLRLTLPGWQEQSPADMGMMLVELLAYAADYLSYDQDAVATEAYLGTARRRISARRHARRDAQGAQRLPVAVLCRRPHRRAHRRGRARVCGRSFGRQDHCLHSRGRQTPADAATSRALERRAR